MSEDLKPSGFTPGPWACQMRFGEWFVRQDPTNWDGNGYQLVCNLPASRKGTHYGEMFAANARLIAAGPDQHAALVDVEVWLTAALECPTWSWDADQHEAATHSRDVARAAIAKALGAEAARSTGGQLCPGTPPDTSWNKRASPPGGEWQGIDTAPRDGTKIDLLYPFPRGRFIDAYWDNGLGWVRRTPRWADGEIDPLPEAQWDWSTLPNMQPIAWMPLPAPPREAVGVGIEGASRTESTDARCDATAGDAQRKSEGGA